MNIVFLGHPGSGKGTQAKLLAKKLGILHVSTGEMFRSIANEKTALGREVKAIIDSGQFVPDDLTVKVVKERLSRKDCKQGFILDGFPRNKKQAQELDAIANIDKAVHLHVEDETVVRRLSARWQCRKCKDIYGLDREPKTDRVCDTCGIELFQRSDDAPDRIKKRIEIYHKETKPLVEYYKKKGVYATVDGEQPITKVFKDICAVLNGSTGAACGC